ncbi:hypothetical protein [Companilactobacillus halodurans]|uniref:Bacteriocin immunity protein n=1 Tax=Companilactobacillus halodurans TaxID=2584183 RepID=A0A5P0ZLT4_9LACO|nr:hypothetical protein [Companilactobacillus halodurans]MQS75210.1 hypothetical protein [Companilactobacillus halodurans]MQS98528.1 hypothetical protein [Companilactobacillus halodurans]
MEKYLEIEAIKNDVIERLKKISVSAELAKQPQLKKLVLHYLKEFQTDNNFDQTIEAFFNAIGIDYLNNKTDFPKSLIELYFYLRIKKSQFDGLDWSATQAGLVWLAK